MKKVERLELENQVLKNAIACALEYIEIGKRTGEEKYLTLAKVEAKLDVEEKIQRALEEKRVVDYRLNAKTLSDCEINFESFGSRVILNDGMVMGFVTVSVSGALSLWSALGRK